MRMPRMSRHDPMETVRALQEEMECRAAASRSRKRAPLQVQLQPPPSATASANVKRQSAPPPATSPPRTLLGDAVSLKQRVACLSGDLARLEEEVSSVREGSVASERRSQLLRQQLRDTRRPPPRLHTSSLNEEEKKIVTSLKHHLRTDSRTRREAAAPADKAGESEECPLTPPEVTAALLRTNPVEQMRVQLDRMQVVSIALQRLGEVQTQRMQQQRDALDATAWEAMVSALQPDASE